MKRKLIAVLACRNNGKRLYAKPLQNLDSHKDISVLQMIIDGLKKNESISKIILAISNRKENFYYKDLAKKNHIEYCFGPDENVLKRLKIGLDKTKGTDLFRITTESPFISHEYVKKIWKLHKKLGNDFTVYSNNVDGMGFEIFTKETIDISNRKGLKKHKSELCDLYVRENIKNFKTYFYKDNLLNKNYRLTIDNPEDLVLCKDLYLRNKKYYPKIPIKRIKLYLKTNNSLIRQVSKYMNKSKSIENLWKNVK